jgi:urease accessory protein
MTLVVFVLAVTKASIAYAHPQALVHTHFSGFDAGLFHPILGLDHLLAMVTVGILAAQAGKRALWLVPGVFLARMVVGGIGGMSGMELWGPELGIAVSVIALGATVASGRSLPLALLVGACGLFGFFHGHAHGSEMPSIAQPALYAIGFVLATLGLHLVGIAIGRFLLQSPSRARVLRLSGAAIAIAGVAFLL